MKQVLILCRREDRSDYDRKDAFSENFAHMQSKNAYTIAEFEDLLFVYDGDQLSVVDTVSGKDVADFDTVFMLGWFKTGVLCDTAKATTHYAKRRGIGVVNTEAHTSRSVSKLSQLVIAHDNGFPVTPFVFSLDTAVLSRALDKHSSILGDPFILKAVNGNKGNDNYLVDASNAHEIIEDQNHDVLFIAQWYVPNDGDLRVIVMGSDVQLVMHRSAAQGSHLNNTSKGGEAAMIDPNELPGELRDASVALAHAFGKEVAGIDVIQHSTTGEYYFLEINNMPQLATGSFVAQKLQALDSYLAEL